MAITNSNLPIIIEYLTRNIPNAFGAYVLQDDGNGDGIYIAQWFEPTLGPQPTEAEIEAAETDAVAWATTPKTIRYVDFFELLSLPLQEAVSDFAALKAAENPPVTKFKMMIDRTNSSTAVIHLDNPAVVGPSGYIMTYINDLKNANILTQAQADDWIQLKQVS